MHATDSGVTAVELSQAASAIEPKTIAKHTSRVMLMNVRRGFAAHRFNSISSTVSEPASTILYRPSPEYPVFNANSESSRVSGNPQSK